MAIIEKFPFELEYPFSRTEYQERQQRLQQMMDRAGVDACMLFTLHSMYYLYGYTIIPGAVVFQSIMVPKNGHPVGVVRQLDAIILRNTDFVVDIDTYPGTGTDPVELALRRLDSFGLKPGAKVGMELMSQQLYPAHYEQLRRGCAARNIEIVDVSSELMDLRLIKSPAEIELMKKAGRFLDITYEAAFAAMRPGAPETAANAAGLYAAHAAGADENAQPLLISSGVNTFLSTHLPATAKTFKKGDVVMMEAGAACRYYHAVGSYSVVCGSKPDGEMLRTYEKARAVINAGRRVMEPGMPIREMVNQMIRAVPDSDGFEFQKNFYGGYGIGLGFPSRWHDTLFITHSETRSIQPGMVIALFGFARMENKYQMLAVDPVVVTDDGFIDLCHLERDVLRTVGMD